MPFDIRTDQPVIEVRFHGVVTNADLRDLAEAAGSIEMAVTVVPHRITDLRPVTRLDIDFAGVAALAGDRRLRRFPNPFKSAIIAPELVQFGFARMFQTLNDHPQIALAIFPGDAEARSWVEAPGQDLPEVPWAPSYRLV